MGQPRQSIAAVSRNDGTIQSVRTERADAADLRGLLALDRRERPDAALALQPHHALVEAAAEHHGPVHPDQLLGGDLGLEGSVEVSVAVEDGEVRDGRGGLADASRHARPALRRSGGSQRGPAGAPSRSFGGDDRP